MKMETLFEKLHPEIQVEIPGYSCERGARVDGLSWLRIVKTTTLKDGFDYPAKHIVTVFSNGTVSRSLAS